MTELFYCNRDRKLTEEDVMFIRNSGLSLRKLARLFSLKKDITISHKTIHYWKSDLNRRVGSLRAIETSRQSRKNRKARLERLNSSII